MTIIIVKGESVSSDSRTKMIRSAATLIRTYGLSATSFTDIVDESGAPRGSIYHHFPNGKNEVAEEAVRWTSARVLEHQRACPATTASGVLTYFIAMWRAVVVASHGAAGCAVAGVALDTPESETSLVDVVRATFRGWAALLAEQFVATGIAPKRAASLAVTALAGMEGALILCRAERNAKPLDMVGTELARLVDAE